jgi:hypothetical protein
MKMTNHRETTQERIKIMQHYADGGEIEETFKNEGVWYYREEPRWNWADHDYRIKEGSKKIESLPYIPTDQNFSFFTEINENRRIINDLANAVNWLMRTDE